MWLNWTWLVSGDINEKMELEGNQTFSDEAIPILQCLYSNGMTGCGKNQTAISALLSLQRAPLLPRLRYVVATTESVYM